MNQDQMSPKNLWKKLIQNNLKYFFKKKEAAPSLLSLVLEHTAKVDDINI